MSQYTDDPRISAYVFAEMDGDQRAAFELEMEESAELRSEVEEVRSTIELISTDLAAEPKIGLGATRKEQLDKTVRRDECELPQQTGSVLWRATVAIVVLLFIFVGYALHVGQTEHNLTPSGRLHTPVAIGPTSEVPTPEVPTSTPSNPSSPYASPAPPQGSYKVEHWNGDRKVVVERPAYTIEQARAASVNSPITIRPGSRIPSTPGFPATAGPGIGGPGTGVPANRTGPQSSDGGQPSGGQPRGVTVTNRQSGGANFTIPAPIGSMARKMSPGNKNLGFAPGRYGGYETLAKHRSPFRGFGREGQLPSLVPGEGRGAGLGGDRFGVLVENEYILVGDDPRSTFSIDVDTASYSKIRQFLIENGTMPNPDAVRIEEMINYFIYDYEAPTSDKPFTAKMEVSACLWNPNNRLARIAIKGKEIARADRKSSNLVFLLDVSGSMNQANKLPLVKKGMKLLVDQLCENDKVSIVVYAGAAGLVLPPTHCDKKDVIVNSLNRLHAGGSTNGGAGIHLAYQTALDNFIEGGTNRVILCTDGDFNVGTTADGELVRIAEKNAKSGVFLSVLGFGIGNLNNSMLEEISNKGNGNYAFIDNQREAEKVLVEQMEGTLITIAKDVKIQVEFNPSEVAAYRLVGYENRIMPHQDFDDDTKDAGDIGAGHTVTALYEIVPTQKPADGEAEELPQEQDELRYQKERRLSKEAKSGEMLLLRLRYKEPESDTSELLEFPVKDEQKNLGQASKDFRFATAVAGFGMLLRNSKFKGDISYDAVLEIGEEAAKDDASGYRSEFLELVKAAKRISGQ